jgi:hypothetical protein
MPRVLHSILIIIVTFVYVLGSRAVVVFEHSHEMTEGHAHHHGNDDDSHGHECPIGSSQDEEPSGDPDSHSHVVALGVDVPFVASGFADVRAVAWTDTGLSLPDADKLPESPCFPLIMPPQLG